MTARDDIFKDWEAFEMVILDALIDKYKAYLINAPKEVLLEEYEEEIGDINLLYE